MMDHRTLTCQGFDDFVKWKNPTKGKILDVGARDSHLKRFFEERGFTWYGCDYCSVQKGREVNPTDVIFCDMQNLEMYKDEEFDCVFSCHSFEHIENPSQALREFKRILKPGGWLFISMPLPNHKYILNADLDHINVLNEMQMERLARWTGWAEFYWWVGENDGAPEQNNNYFLLRKPL